MSIPETTAIIVNYRSQGHVLELLNVLRKRLDDCPEQIIVVDNSPQDGLGTQFLLHEPGVHYLAMERNIGFAAAVNRGLALAKQPWIVLLNPDARPEPGCLPGLLSELHTD
jgi:N-acetylglucosaminyl-diphospho-decaprenol L-rhamnosyltransferase